MTSSDAPTLEPPYRVELGSGGRKIDGWLSYDLDMPIDRPIRFQDSTCAIVYISHCLEHVDAHDGFRFMKEVHRILIPGGIFRIAVPILDRINDRKHATDLILGHTHLMVYSFESLAGMLFAAGFSRDKIVETGKIDLDVHGRVIGEEKNALESLYVEANK